MKKDSVQVFFSKFNFRWIMLDYDIRVYLSVTWNWNTRQYSLSNFRTVIQEHLTTSHRLIGILFYPEHRFLAFLDCWVIVKDEPHCDQPSLSLLSSHSDSMDSCLSNLDNSWHWRQVAVQKLFWGMLLPGFVQNSMQHQCKISI